MSSKKQSYALATLITIIAGVGMLSTAMSAMATTNNDANTQAAYQNVNENNNKNSNSNNNTIVMGGQSPQLAQIPSYQYPPSYQPPMSYPPAPPAYIPPPAPAYYEAPGVPNAGFGDIPTLNLAILLTSAIFVIAGIAYIFPWSKHDVKYS
jgi:hypothetical protein